MDHSQLAQKIKSLRKSNGLSQEALAEIAGLSLRTVQRIENENKNPSGDTLKRLSTALRVSPDYLLEWQPNQNPNFLLILSFSPILYIVNPLLAVIAPLILWSIKKSKIKGVNVLGIKVLKIEMAWLIVFYIFRTLNFLRLKHTMDNTKPFTIDELDALQSDIATQSYLKMFFMAVNTLIIIYMTYKTYRNNQQYSNKNLNINPS